MDSNTSRYFVNFNLQPKILSLNLLLIFTARCLKLNSNSLELFSIDGYGKLVKCLNTVAHYINLKEIYANCKILVIESTGHGSRESKWTIRVARSFVNWQRRFLVLTEVRLQFQNKNSNSPPKRREGKGHAWCLIAFRWILPSWMVSNEYL